MLSLNGLYVQHAGRKGRKVIIYCVNDDANRWLYLSLVKAFAFFAFNILNNSKDQPSKTFLNKTTNIFFALPFLFQVGKGRVLNHKYF